MTHRGRRKQRQPGEVPTFRGTSIAGINYEIPDGFPPGPKGERYIRILPFQRWIYVDEDTAKPKEKEKVVQEEIPDA